MFFTSGVHEIYKVKATNARIVYEQFYLSRKWILIKKQVLIRAFVANRLNS
jgi:hypothetical protein